jgi:hypothetical protein
LVTEERRASVEVFLKDKDRIALQHSVWNGSEASYVVIAADWDSEAYNVLSRTIDPDTSTAYVYDGGPWTLLWRDDSFKKCLGWVEGLLEDLENDFGHLEWGVQYRWEESNSRMVPVGDLIVSHPFLPSDTGQCAWMVDEDGSQCGDVEKRHQN